MLTRDEVERWLSVPVKLRNEYETLLIELNDPIVKTEELAVQTMEKYSELLRVWEDRLDLLIEHHNPHVDILSKYYLSCYNPMTIAKEYNVSVSTIKRWISDGITAIMNDPVLTPIICANRGNSVK